VSASFSNHYSAFVNTSPINQMLLDIAVAGLHPCNILQVNKYLFIY